MNNKPVAWMNKIATSWVTTTPDEFKDEWIPLYTHPAKEHFEDEPQAEELHEIMQSNAHPVKELSRMDVYELAIESGFMLSTQYGEAEHKLMPVSDGDTLVKLANVILKKAQER